MHIEKGAKGWMLVADAGVPAGEFVCEYAGELLTTIEAELRLAEYDRRPADRQGHALLVVREIMPSGGAALRLNIDATARGNVARFMNHSCDGGNTELALVRARGSLLPRACLFASRDILPGEELTFCYGVAEVGASEGNTPRCSRKCLCGTPACRGFLPSSA